MIKASPPEPTLAPATTVAGTSSSEAETTFTTTTYTTSFEKSHENSVSSPSASAFEPVTVAAQSSLWNMPKPQRFPWAFTPDHGILITGGNGSNTAELLDNSGKRTTCSLPDIPSKERYRHTQTGRVLCGGTGGSNDGGPATERNYETTCLKLFDSGWSKNPLKYLEHPRIGHTSWRSEQGLILMGGGLGQFSSSLNSTEMLTRNQSETTPMFNLKYPSQS